MVEKKEIDDDLDKDGKISEAEIEYKMKFEKAITQNKLAIIALTAMIVTMAILLSPLITPEKTKELSSLVDMFFISMASIIGAFMGFTAWMSKGK